MPGNGGSVGLGNHASNFRRQGTTPATGEDEWDGEGNDSATGDMHPDQAFPGVSFEGASLNEESNGASDLLPAHTAVAPHSSSSTEHPTNTNIQTPTSTHQTTITSSDMTSPATEVTLGEEDKSSKKRTLLPTGEADDDITLTQNTAKKPKLYPADLKLKKATVPELGSDEPSPTPPASKKNKGRVSKAAAPKKLDNEAGEGENKLRGVAKTPTGPMRGGHAAMLSRSGGYGQVRGGGHQHGRRAYESPAVPYDGDSERYEEESRVVIYPQDPFRDNSHHYGPEEYGMVSGRQYHPYQYGGLPPRAPYEIAYSGLQPHHPPNPSFTQHTDDRHGPRLYYASHAMGLDSHRMSPLNPNVTSFGPTYQPNPAATASRMSSAPPPNPATTAPRPTSSQPLSHPTFTPQINPSTTASHQVDTPATTSRSVSAQSNTPVTADFSKPTEGEGTRPRQVKIYLADGVETMAETCPCCRRGF